MNKKALVLLTLSVGVILAACADNECIVPPTNTSVADKKVAVDLAAKLEHVPLDANVKTAFEQHMASSYQSLSDKNVSLFLCLRAIDCYGKHKSLSPVLQQELIEIVRAFMMGKQGVAGGSGPLSPLERRVIERGTNAKEIIDLFDKLGVPASP